jgi:hypothetical protein
MQTVDLLGFEWMAPLGFEFSADCIRLKLARSILSSGTHFSVITNYAFG